jgi:O-antigen ligase
MPLTANIIECGGRAPQPTTPAAPWPATSTVGLAGVVVLLLAAPFETTGPWVRVLWQSMSSLEVVVLVVCALWAAARVRSGATARWRTPLTVPGVALLAALGVASIAAPADRVNALHMTGRLAAASALCLLTFDVVRTAEGARRVLLAGCLSGVAAAALVALDYSRLPLGQWLLEPFRTHTASVGIQVRASGSFQYPTIASMFLELTFACGVGLVPAVWDRRRPAARAALAAGLVVMAAGITLTYTRAGFLTMAVTLALVAMQRVRLAGVDGAVRALGAVALAIVALVPALRSIEDMRLRLSSEGQEGWYRADIQAPPSLELATGGRIPVPVTVRNTGRVTWDSAAVPPFRFSYHWLLDESDRVVSWEGLRTSFPAPVAPGERVQLTVPVEAPREPGIYRVVWDLEQERHLWFSTEPGAELAVSRAVVRGPWSGPPVSVESLPAFPLPAVRPRRSVLWTAAVRMLAERPWLGIGPDNFRLHYGPYAGLRHADSRVHTNNMYLELLVGGGLAAGLALAWLLWRSARLVGSLLRPEPDRERAALRAAAAAALCAIGLHGLVDSFLGFTPTYVVIGIMVGLALACAPPAGEAHAHRV